MNDGPVGDGANEVYAMEQAAGWEREMKAADEAARLIKPTVDEHLRRQAEADQPQQHPGNCRCKPPAPPHTNPDCPFYRRWTLWRWRYIDWSDWTKESPGPWEVGDPPWTEDHKRFGWAIEVVEAEEVDRG